MPSPRPLTLCPAVQLDWSRPATPAATDFGDIYFSTDGGLDEARTVFLQGCGLPEGWQNTERFVIGELGFGTGLNFLATRQMWDKTKPKNGHLHFVSIEKFPFDSKQLSKALKAWPELETYASQLMASWPGRVRGFHRLHFGDVTLTLVHDDINEALLELNLQANAWFLDGFNPKKNPDMWTPDIMKRLALLSASGARLATFTVAGPVRQALEEAGFMIQRKKGFGRKRNRLEACLDGQFQPFFYSDIEKPTIIGGGIGGLSIAKAMLRHGIKPILMEDPNHIAASGNAAALVKPRLDLQDRPESRFFLGSYLFALQTYGNAVISEGVTHIPKSDAEHNRHQKLIQQNALGEEHLNRGTEGEILFPKAQVIAPLEYKNHILGDVDYIVQALDCLPSDKKTAFIAAGYGINRLIPDWPLRFSRGQITWAESSPNVSETITYGGYAIPLQEMTLIGATHNRLNKEVDPYELDKADDIKNLEQFEMHTKLKINQTRSASRASVRVTSPDTLPVLGQTKAGHFVLTGLGSRGFVFAPLLADAIVSHYLGDPLPIPQSVWDKFSVKRILG